MVLIPNQESRSRSRPRDAEDEFQQMSEESDSSVRSSWRTMPDQEEEVSEGLARVARALEETVAMRRKLDAEKAQRKQVLESDSAVTPLSEDSSWNTEDEKWELASEEEREARFGEENCEIGEESDRGVKKSDRGVEGDEQRIENGHAGRGGCGGTYCCLIEFLLHSSSRLR